MASKPSKAAAKTAKVLHEFKVGDLHSGSKKGPVVTSRDQAIAIALNQARKAAPRSAPKAPPKAKR